MCKAAPITPTALALKLIGTLEVGSERAAGD
jgi:hypothetical protein